MIHIINTHHQKQHLHTCKYMWKSTTLTRLNLQVSFLDIIASTVIFQILQNFYLH